MGRMRKILTDAELIQAIWREGDRLRDEGVDLSKVQIVSEKDNNSTDSVLCSQIYQVCQELKATGKDLSKIPITKGRDA